MAFDAFLTFAGTAASPFGPIAINGKSTDPDHPGAIELKAFDFAIANTVSIGSAGGGAGAGKAQFRPLQIIKAVDSTSPAFLMLVGAGAHFQTVRLALRKAGKLDFVVYTFGLVFVTSQETTGSAGDNSPTETINFAYGSLQVQFSVNNKGAIRHFDGSWDQTTNSVID